MPVSKNKITEVLIDPRIAELQKKIMDENYVNSAVDRIAVIMSRMIVEGHSTTGKTADVLV